MTPVLVPYGDVTSRAVARPTERDPVIVSCRVIVCAVTWTVVSVMPNMFTTRHSVLRVAVEPRAQHPRVERLATEHHQPQPKRLRAGPVGLDELGERVRGLVQHGDPLGGQQRPELLGRRGRPSRARSRAAPRTAGTPRPPTPRSRTRRSGTTSTCRRERGRSRSRVPASSAITLRCGTTTPFGASRGTRRVDHVGRVVRAAAGSRQRARAARQLLRAHGAGTRGIRRRHDEAQPGVPGDVGEPLGRMRGVHRDVHRARPEDTQHRDHQVEGALEADPDPLTRAGSRRPGGRPRCGWLVRPARRRSWIGRHR